MIPGVNIQTKISYAARGARIDKKTNHKKGLIRHSVKLCLHRCVEVQHEMGWKQIEISL